MMAARVRQHRNALQMRADKPNWREETKRQNSVLGDTGAKTTGANEVDKTT